MKIKILRGDRGKWYHITDNVGREFCVIGYYENSPLRFAVGDGGGYWVDKDDCVITELPESFCVKRVSFSQKWEKYIDWLRNKYAKNLDGYINIYYGVKDEYSFGKDKPFGIEIHIDDIIKHIDFYSEPMPIESKEEVKEDLTIVDGVKLEVGQSYYVRYKHGVQSEWMLCRITRITDHGHAWSDTKGGIITNGSYDVKTIEEFENKSKMGTQKLSRKGLKEIHSVACSNWKGKLEGMGIRNSLEDYIEVTQSEVDEMFKACTKDQLPIVSKYLKQDDGSVDIMKFKCEIYDANGRAVIEKRFDGEYAHKSLLLDEEYDWEIKKDSKGYLCLIPTKKK